MIYVLKPVPRTFWIGAIIFGRWPRGTDPGRRSPDPALPRQIPYFRLNHGLIAGGRKRPVDHVLPPVRAFPEFPFFSTRRQDVAFDSFVAPMEYGDRRRRCTVAGYAGAGASHAEDRPGVHGPHQETLIRPADLDGA